MLTQKIEIELSGKSESDLEYALEEAVRRIKAGNVVGHDSNDDGSFYFSSTTEGDPEYGDEDELDEENDEDNVPALR